MKVRNVYLLHLGVGNVGQELVRQITSQRKQIRDEFGVDLIYCGLYTSKTGIFNKNGLKNFDRSTFIPVLQKDVQASIREISFPFILIDTTASDQTVPLLKLALQKGGAVVMSNKKPLTGSQKEFTALQEFGESRLLYETTVGAGLPVVQTIKTLIGTGDEIVEIKGCFSGTLGFLFSELEKGATFSKAVLDAKQKGFTEPDPRDDLSGMDVARKALILSRIFGVKMDLQDIQLESLFPKTMGKLSVDEFIKQLSSLDDLYQKKIADAKKQSQVLRYIATVTKNSCHVRMEAVPKHSEIGNLQGPDNIISIKTKRYFDNPMIIRGPGAGVEVTAAGVFGDILSVVKMI